MANTFYILSCQDNVENVDLLAKWGRFESVLFVLQGRVRTFLARQVWTFLEWEDIFGKERYFWKVRKCLVNKDIFGCGHYVPFSFLHGFRVPTSIKIQTYVCGFLCIIMYISTIYYYFALCGFFTDVLFFPSVLQTWIIEDFLYSEDK